MASITWFGGAGYILRSTLSMDGLFASVLAIISGLGALNGWTMVTAEMPYAAAKDGLFLPAFAKENSRGAPWFGIVASTVVGSLLMAWSYSGETGLKVFTYLVYLSVVTVAIPYFLSACAQLAFLVSRRRAVQGWQLTRDLTIAVVGGLFALWVTFAAGYQSVYQSMLLLLLGIPVYGFLKARRERLGQIDEPIDMPAVLVDN